MGDYRTRAITRDDASAVNDLLAAAEAVEHTGEHYTVDDVVEELENPMIDPARDWLVVEHEGRVVAHGQLTPRAPFDGALKVDVGGTVHPDHRGRGIGSQLVPTMLDRAHDYVRERGADLSPVITARAPSGNTDLADILGRHGLVPHRWSFLMHCELSHVPDPDDDPPAGYVVTTWQGVDQDELRRAHNAAFVDHPGFVPWSRELWSHWVSRTRNSRPELSLVARDATGRVAAYVQMSEFDAVELATGVREVYVHKVGTLPAHRRRGLGGALLRSSLQRCREAGYAVATLDVDSENPTGALGLYESVGFRTIQRWTDYLLPVPADQ